MRRIAIACLAVWCVVGAAAAGDGPSGQAAPDPRFEFLKTLAGTWHGTSDSKQMAEGDFEFRLTAGGSAIEAREMLGTPMEMLTVYHMHGRDLVGTHYCAMGNQPKVVAARSVQGDTLHFACDGKPGNTAAHDEDHVHGWSLRREGDDTLRITGRMFQNGEIVDTPEFVLTRRTQQARR